MKIDEKSIKMESMFLMLHRSRRMCATLFEVFFSAYERRDCSEENDAQGQCNNDGPHRHGGARLLLTLTHLAARDGTPGRRGFQERASTSAVTSIK